MCVWGGVSVLNRECFPRSQGLGDVNIFRTNWHIRWSSSSPSLISPTLQPSLCTALYFGKRNLFCKVPLIESSLKVGQVAATFLFVTE